MSFKKASWISAPLAIILALFLGGCKYSAEKGGYDLSRFRRESGLTSVPDELRGVVPSNDETVRAILTHTPERDLRFVIIGDTVSDGNKTFKGFLGEIAELEPRPSFIVHLGDRVASPVVESYGAYFRAIQNPPCPILQVNGNHDLREEGDRISRAFFGDRDYYFDRGDMRFIFMDDNPEHGRRGGHGGFSRAQLVWLEDKLKASHPARKFFFAHIPPQAPFKRIDPGLASLLTPAIDNEADFLGLLARYHVVMAAFGHRHVHAEELYNGVLMVITGGGGQRTTFNPQVDEPRFTKKHHYTLVDLPGSGPFGTLEGTLFCMGRDHETLSVVSFSQRSLVAGSPPSGSVALEPYPASSRGPLKAGPRPFLFRPAPSSRTP
jgi:hypothetical protein